MTPTLSTLVADLVGETAEGVREANVAAARRRASLAALDDEPTDADVDDALADLFPPLRRPPVDLLARVLDDEALDEYVSGWRPGETSIRPGEVYLHSDLVEGVAEFPPVERELDVSILETVERGEGVARLTGKSVAVVRERLRDRLAAERRTAAAAFADGVPTPVVETATVEAKAAFGGGDGRIEATLLDGEERVRPEQVGSVTTDLRFVSLPADGDPDRGAGADGTGDDRTDDGDGHIPGRSGRGDAPPGRPLDPGPSFGTDRPRRPPDRGSGTDRSGGRR